MQQILCQGKRVPLFSTSQQLVAKHMLYISTWVISICIQFMASLYTFKDPQHQNLCTSQRFSSINWADATVHQRICMTLTDNFSSHFSFYNDTASLKELSLYVLNIQKLRYVVKPKMCLFSFWHGGKEKVYKPHAGSCQQ